MVCVRAIGQAQTGARLTNNKKRRKKKKTHTDADYEIFVAPRRYDMESPERAGEKRANDHRESE